MSLDDALYDESGAPVQWEFVGAQSWRPAVIGGGVRGSAFDTSADDGGYWPEIVSGDLVSDTMLGADEAVAVTQRVVERMRDGASPPAPQVVVGEGEAAPVDADDLVLAEVMLLGADGDATAVEDLFPVTVDLYRHFRKEDLPVRLDTQESYGHFRAEGSGDIAALRAQVAELADRFEAHLRDPEAHGRLRELVGAIERARVPLQLPPEMAGAWDCWREGDLVCCSVALPGRDGCVKICTTATDVVPYVREVVGHARQVLGGDVGPLIGVLPTVSAMRAGGSMLPRACAAAPALVARDEAVGSDPFVGRVVAMNHPSRAALIALLQRAQYGDAQARREWEALAALCTGSGGGGLCRAMLDAQDRLAKAQGR